MVRIGIQKPTNHYHLELPVFIVIFTKYLFFSSKANTNEDGATKKFELQSHYLGASIRFLQFS